MSNRRAFAGSRAELLHSYHRIRRLRLTMLALVAAGLVVAATVALGADRLARDPGFAVLDEVAVSVLDPESVRESGYGNRWCIGQCRVRERTWDSTVSAPQTRDAVAGALDGRGWLAIDDCEADEGVARLCLKRDEFLLDIWFTPVGCESEAQCSTAVVTAVARQATGPAAGLTGSPVRSTLLVRAS